MGFGACRDVAIMLHGLAGNRRKPLEIFGINLQHAATRNRDLVRQLFQFLLLFQRFEVVAEEGLEPPTRGL